MSYGDGAGGMSAWLADAPDTEVIALCDILTDQLAERPWAEVVCPLGRVRIDLVPARG